MMQPLRLPNVENATSIGMIHAITPNFFIAKVYNNQQRSKSLTHKHHCFSPLELWLMHLLIINATDHQTCKSTGSECNSDVVIAVTK